MSQLQEADLTGSKLCLLSKLHTMVPALSCIPLLNLSQRTYCSSLVPNQMKQSLLLHHVSYLSWTCSI